MYFIVNTVTAKAKDASQYSSLIGQDDVSILCVNSRNEVQLREVYFTLYSSKGGHYLSVILFKGYASSRRLFLCKCWTFISKTHG